MRLINVLETFTGTALEGNVRAQRTSNERIMWIEEEFLEAFESHHGDRDRCAGVSTMNTSPSQCGQHGPQSRQRQE